MSLYNEESALVDYRQMVADIARQRDNARIAREESERESILANRPDLAYSAGSYFRVVDSGSSPVPVFYRLSIEPMGRVDRNQKRNADKAYRRQLVSANVETIRRARNHRLGGKA